MLKDCNIVRERIRCKAIKQQYLFFWTLTSWLCAFTGVSTLCTAFMTIKHLKKEAVSDVRDASCKFKRDYTKFFYSSFFLYKFSISSS